MAKPRMDLPAFVGKLLEEDHGDVLREGVQVLAQALMEAEVTELVGAGRYERTDERTAHRNGSRARTWDTRVGTLELAVPDAALEPAGGLPTAQDISAAPGAQDLPVPTSRSGDHAAESGVVLGRDVHSADARLSLSGRGHGLGKPEGLVLAAVKHA